MWQQKDLLIIKMKYVIHKSEWNDDDWLIDGCRTFENG